MKSADLAQLYKVGWSTTGEGILCSLAFLFSSKHVSPPMELYDNDKQDEVSALGKDPKIKEI
jgi:hypothetical protein